jgi:hypothetical protein
MVVYKPPFLFGTSNGFIKTRKSNTTQSFSEGKYAFFPVAYTMLISGMVKHAFPYFCSRIQTIAANKTPKK